jgi:hypothetical protein
MQTEVIQRLKKLSLELEKIRDKKKDAVNKQKYELAAAMRDEERQLYNLIDQTVKIKESDFDSKELLQVVKKDLYEIISFIEEGDSNLTPALIRKLKTDAIEAKSESERIKEMMDWTHVYNKRPELVEEVEVDGKKLVQSKEVVILFVTEAGEYDVCVGRYVMEKRGVHDKSYYFVTKNPGDSISINDAKGWRDITGEAKGWIGLPDKRIR